MSNSAETGKGRLRLNIIDFLLIAVILAAAVGIAMRYDLADRVVSRTENTTVRIRFIIEDVRPTSIDAVLPDDTVVWAANGMTVGKIISSEASDAGEYYDRADGTKVKQFSTTRADITGVIEAKGIFTDEGFMLGGSRYVGAGMEMAVTSEHLSTKIVILGIDRDI